MKNYLKHLLVIIILFCTYTISFAQTEPSAIMNIESTEQGMLVPRMTTTQRVAIANPAKGLLVFDNTTSSFWFYEGSAWIVLGGGASGGSVWLKNNTDAYYNNGTVGIGTDEPESKLHLKGNAGLLNLEGDTHAYLQFYPDGYDAGRKGWLGFDNASTESITLSNEFVNGGLNFRTNGVNNRMYINKDGNIGIGTASPQARLNILSTSDVNQASGGFLILGVTSALNIGIDNNEIQARNNGTVSSLFINADGGDTQLNVRGGKVVIGDIPVDSRPGDYKMYVEKGILAERIRVALETSVRWADDAFDKTPTLKKVEKHIAKHSHLFGVPSAKELVKTGIDVAEMDATLLRQIEWLWVSLIEKDKENKEQNDKIESLEKRLDRLEKALKK